MRLTLRSLARILNTLKPRRKISSMASSGVTPPSISCASPKALTSSAVRSKGTDIFFSIAALLHARTVILYWKQFSPIAGRAVCHRPIGSLADIHNRISYDLFLETRNLMKLPAKHAVNRTQDIQTRAVSLAHFASPMQEPI